MKRFIITGTDTDVGKTLCASLLMAALQGTYWKPIQSGADENGKTDYDVIKEITCLSNDHFIAPIYSFKSHLSPHRAAELDDVKVDTNKLKVPNTTQKNPLFIEGAGGLMVPVTRDILYIDLFQQWNIPVVLCARTGLGTINHTLLSVEALKQRNITIHGIVFVGPDNPDNMKTIVEFSSVKKLGWIPQLAEINCETLVNVFNQYFDKNDWL